MSIRSTFGRLKRHFDRYEPLIEIGISKENLLHNLHAYQEQYPELRFAPVLKSNAYGHGLSLVARILDTEDIAFFAVDSHYEARRLRRDGIRSPLLVMGYIRPEDIARSRLPDTDYGVVDLEQLRALTQYANHPVRIHLKLDTGMHRQGLVPEELPEAATLLKQNQHLKVVGIYTHFGDADNPDTKRTDGQIQVWKDAMHTVDCLFPYIEHRHLAATKGIPLIEGVGSTAARLGIGLYGFNTSPHMSLALKPVLEMRSLVAGLRTVPQGDWVSYAATYTAPSDRIIATVPVGYYEGFDRKLSNVGSMTVRGVACPVAGRISMNMTTLDVTDAPGVRQGDPVIVISRNPEDPNSISSIMQLVDIDGYTEYVFLVHIPEHLRRVVE
jgi:alanine racemase